MPALPVGHPAQGDALPALHFATATKFIVTLFSF
jgi:hypothetical protein